MKTRNLLIGIIVALVLYTAGIAIYGMIVFITFSDCHGNLSNAGSFGDMFGAFNAFFTGLAFLAVAMTVYLQFQETTRLQAQISESKIENRVAERQKYLTTLITIQNELAFYRTKFIQLSGEVAAAVIAAQNNQPVILPTYRLYPDFLENQKIELSKFHFDSELIKDVGYCHFELRHIIERLTLYLEQMISLNPQNATVYLGNALGFKGLLDGDTKTFEDTINRFQAEVDKTKDQIAKRIP
ncbi:MAG TPA: hypothetical protein VLX91_01320 [Candidatus Acidoferrales bacterium]|nr:hypothetical protein [Candidatus Acidoferrales bacterium]